MGQAAYSKWKKLSVYVVIGIGIYIGIRCLAGAVFPFFAAILLVKLFYPVADFLQRKMKISCGISVFVLFILFVVLAGVLLWLVLQKLFGQLGVVFDSFSVYETYMDGFLKTCCGQLEKYFGLKAEVTEPYILGRFYAIVENLKSSIEEGIMSYSLYYAKEFVKIIGVTVVVMALTVLLAKDYKKLQKQVQKTAFYSNIIRLKEKVFHASFVYLRAQFFLLLLISVVCVVAFFLLKINNALLYGVGIGVLDAVPFLGTGSILIPWAVVKLLQGDVLTAAILGTLYMVCSLIREFLEPRLIGDKLGVLPVYIIGTVYVGLVFYGFWGVVLGPLHALLTVELGRQWLEEHS